MRQQGILLSFFMVLSATNIFAQENKTTQIKENKVNYEIIVKQTQAQPALVIKGKVKVEQAGDAIGEILGKIGAHLEKNHIQPVGTPFTRTYSFENGVLEFEAGFPVPKGTAGTEGIIATELPKALVASTLHVGSQSTSEEAYKALHIWIQKKWQTRGWRPMGVLLNRSCDNS